MKYLIVYASAGEGHKKAAGAIYEALAEKIDKKDIAIIDSLDYSNDFFKWMYSKKYLTLISYMPQIWGFFYSLFNKKIVYRFLRLPRRMVNGINCRRFEEFLCREKPEAVISTHFMANEVVSHLKEKGKLSCKLFSAITDYRLHAFWVTPEVDCYFVAIGKTKEDLLEWGIPENKIHVTGIPISPKFSLAQDKARVMSRLGLSNNCFTVLIMSGGFGIGPVDELVRSISAISPDIQLLVVCGTNKGLYEQINKTVSDLNIKAKFFGFVNNIDELMIASDLLVTKSGGLTSAEALALGLPVIFIKPISGQEKRNSVLLEEKKAAFIAYDVKEVREKVERLLREPDLLKEMTASIKIIAKPNSARDMVNIITRNFLP